MMKKRFLLLLLLIFMAASLRNHVFGLVAADEDLPPKYKKWVEEEVIHIITPIEKEVFLSFKTDKDREIFIRAFWKQRDPIKETAENEFELEHYKRLNYANKFFGRDTTRPGCLTDRGRTYIILGPPQDIDRFEGLQYIHPAEVWFYSGLGKPSLPSAFNVVFFKREGLGEYRLYSPVSDGPVKFFYNYTGDPTDNEAVYMKLREMEPELSNYVLTLIPGEPIYAGSPSLLSENLLVDIQELPKKEVADQYAKALRDYKENIEVEYTSNYIETNMLLGVFKDEKGRFFVHYSIEPKTLSVDSAEDSYYANFLINGNLVAPDGKTIFQYEKKFPFKFTKAQIDVIQGTSLAIQDVIPVVPGQYKFNLLIKNSTSKEFSSQEKVFSVPLSGDGPHFSKILLGFATEKNPASEINKKPFEVGDLHFKIYSQYLFDGSDILNVGFQVFGLSRDFEKGGSVKIAIIQNSIPIKEKEVPIRSNPADDITIHESFPLSEIKPGYYEITVVLLNSQGEKLISGSENFALSSQTRLPKPVVYSSKYPSDSLEYPYILGRQYSNLGDLSNAEKLLKSAYSGNPKALNYAVAYSQVLMQQQKYEDVKDVLLPFDRLESVSDFQFLALLGRAFHLLKDYESAIQYYHKSLLKQGTNLFLLNDLGECYFLKGNQKEALSIWQKSLEINPNQEEIIKKIKSIKN